MSAQHTPGPWKPAKHSSGGETGADIDVETDAPGHPGWFMRLSPGYPFSKMVYPAEAEAEFNANCALIFAAAELLAGATAGLASMERELAGILESHCHLDAELNPIRETLDEEVKADVEALEASIAQSRAAIAKATGGA